MGLKKIRPARRAALFATFVAFALATGAAPTPAAAKYGGGHYRGGHHVKVHKGAHHAYRRRHHYARVFGYVLGYRPYYPYYAPQRHAYVPQFRPPYPYDKPPAHRAYGRACHTVSKVGYDGYGRKAKIGGTMCYDAYGNSYIVAGSRYVIHYY